MTATPSPSLHAARRHQPDAAAARRRPRRRRAPISSPSAPRRPRPRPICRPRSPPASARSASTSLSAASAMAASNDFFDDPPQRVGGSPVHRDRAGRRHRRQYRVLVHRRGRHRIGALDRDRAHRSIDDGLLRHAGQRTGHPLDRAEHRGAGGDQLLRRAIPMHPPAMPRSISRVYTALGVPAGVQKITDIESEPRQCADGHGFDAKPAPADGKHADHHAAIDRGRRYQTRSARRFCRCRPACRRRCRPRRCCPSSACSIISRR